MDIVKDVIEYLENNITEEQFPKIIASPLRANSESISIILMPNASGKRDLESDVSDRIAISIFSKSKNRNKAIEYNNKITSTLENADIYDIGDVNTYRFYWAELYTNLNLVYVDSDGSFVFNSSMYLNIERSI